MDDEKEMFTHFPGLESTIRQARELLSALRLVVAGIATHLREDGVGPYMILLRSVLRELDDRMDNVEAELERAGRESEHLVQTWTEQMDRLQNENRQLRQQAGQYVKLSRAVSLALLEPVPAEVMFYRHAYRNLPASVTAEEAPNTGYEKIRAIKVARERYGMQLSDAKQYVEAIPVLEVPLEEARAIVAKFDEVYAGISLDTAEIPPEHLESARRAATWDKLVDMWLMR